MINENRISGLILLAFFLGYGYLAQDIQLDFWAAEELFTAQTFPSLIAIGGTILSLLLIIAGGPIEPPRLTWARVRPVIALLALMVCFTLLLDLLGFILTGIVLLSTGSFLLGERRWLLIALSSAGVVIGLYLLLTALDIYLEPGLIGELL